MLVSFLFAGDLNGHHHLWLGSTNRHGVAAFDFATVSGCDQMGVVPTHARGLTLDLLITDVPDVVRVAVVAPIGNKDHSSLSAVFEIRWLKRFQTCVLVGKFFLKHQVNWKTVCGAIQNLSWRNVRIADNPVKVLNEHLSLLIVRYLPTKVICVRNKDKPWFDNQRRRAFGLK